VLRFSSLNGRAQKSRRDTRRLVSVRSLKAASLASALTNFLREGRRESCMHTRTPPSRLFSLHTCRLCLRLRLRLRFSFHTSHESTTATWESKLVAVGAITLGPELHGFDVIARMGTDVSPSDPPSMALASTTTGDETVGIHASGEQCAARVGTKNAPRDSGVRSAPPWRRVLSAFATGGQADKACRFPSRASDTVRELCFAAGRLHAWRGSDATHASPPPTAAVWAAVACSQSHSSQ